MSPADGDVLPVLDLRFQLRDLTDQLLDPLDPLFPRFPRRHGIPCSLDRDRVAGVLDRDGRQGLVPSLGHDAGCDGVPALMRGSR